VGGAETQLRHLLEQYDRESVELILILFSDWSCSATKFASSAGIRLIRLVSTTFDNFLMRQIRLIRIIKQERPMAVYSLLPNANLLNAIASFSKHKYKVVWGMRSSQFTLGRFGFRGLLVRWLTSVVACRVDLLISNTQAGLRQMNRGPFQVKRAIVIPNGIDTTRFFPDHEVRHKLRNELGIPNAAFVIGLVARVVSWKGYDIFFDAARTLIPKANREVIFLCVGSGDPELEKKYFGSMKRGKPKGKCLWLGSRNDVDKILNVLDVLTVCSLEGEGFPNIIGEALATDIPVVATRVGDAPSVVGTNGLLIAPSDASELRNAWSKLLESPEELAERARGSRSRVISDYSVNRCVNATIQEITGIRSRHQTHE
jgi:glycosyltransferase involved in cell wall biosynthesis